MQLALRKARFDWLVELAGACALGLAGGYAALKLAPSFAVTPLQAMAVAGLCFFTLGMLAMRAAAAGPADYMLPEFTLEPLAGDELLLLLDSPVDELLLLDARLENVLLLEDALPQPDPASRVVQLFAAQEMATPGELKAAELPQSDAAAALYAALDELKRSLR